jgi:hypothetical protein
VASSSAVGGVRVDGGSDQLAATLGATAVPERSYFDGRTLMVGLCVLSRKTDDNEATLGRGIAVFARGNPCPNEPCQPGSLPGGVPYVSPDDARWGRHVGQPVSPNCEQDGPLEVAPFPGRRRC